LLLPILTKRYGVQGYKTLRTALDAYVEVADAHLVALDDPDDETLKDLDLPPAAGAEPGSLLLPLRAVRRKLACV